MVVFITTPPSEIVAYPSVILDNEVISETHRRRISQHAPSSVVNQDIEASLDLKESLRAGFGSSRGADIERKPMDCPGSGIFGNGGLDFCDSRFSSLLISGSQVDLT